MRGIALLIVLALAACKSAPTPPAVGGGKAPAVGGWETASGKPPSKVEFAALVAACEDREHGGKLAYPPGGSLDSCLADLGLRRAAP